jgi:hypothetical protein
LVLTTELSQTITPNFENGSKIENDINQKMATSSAENERPNVGEQIIEDEDDIFNIKSVTVKPIPKTEEVKSDSQPSKKIIATSAPNPGSNPNPSKKRDRKRGGNGKRGTKKEHVEVSTPTSTDSHKGEKDGEEDDEECSLF